MWCSVGAMLLSGAQHNFANMYDPIKNKLANVNKILCSLRYWGVMLLVYISTIPAISACAPYSLARIIESKMAWSRRLVEGARSTLGVGAGHTGGA